jgi:hypothetical protein
MNDFHWYACMEYFLIGFVCIYDDREYKNMTASSERYNGTVD